MHACCAPFTLWRIYYRTHGEFTTGLMAACRYIPLCRYMNKPWVCCSLSIVAVCTHDRTIARRQAAGDESSAGMHKRPTKHKHEHDGVHGNLHGAAGEVLFLEGPCLPFYLLNN